MKQAAWNDYLTGAVFPNSQCGHFRGCECPKLRREYWGFLTPVRHETCPWNVGGANVHEFSVACLQMLQKEARLSLLANPYHMSGEGIIILGRQSYDECWEMICMHRLEFKWHHFFFLCQKLVQPCVPLLLALFQINLSLSQMNFSWRMCMLYSIRKLDWSIVMDVWLAHLTYIL